MYSRYTYVYPQYILALCLSKCLKYVSVENWAFLWYIHVWSITLDAQTYLKHSLRVLKYTLGILRVFHKHDPGILRYTLWYTVSGMTQVCSTPKIYVPIYANCIFPMYTPAVCSLYGRGMPLGCPWCMPGMPGYTRCGVDWRRILASLHNGGWLPLPP